MRDRDFKKKMQARQRRARAEKFPMITLCRYGSDDKTVTKVVAAFYRFPKDPREILKRWTAAGIMESPKFRQELLAFIQAHRPRTIVLTSGVIGCIHEEGIDYPLGQDCPFCLFWKGRDRWAGVQLLELTVSQFNEDQPWPV